MTKDFIFNVKVYYEDTDAGGVVYYANYLKYLERARTELIYKLSLNHKVLNKVHNTYIVVRSCKIKYKKPGFFEDKLTIYTKLKGFSDVHLTLIQSIKRNKELIVSAEIQLVTINKEGKPIKMPDILINKLKAIN